MSKQSQINHVAIIMDGNGRWAKQRLRPRVWGHIRGASVVADIVEQADDLGVQSLTLYAFSTENWSRPDGEVRLLFKLLRKFLEKEYDRIIENNIRFRVIGDTSGLPRTTLRTIENLSNKTVQNSGLKLNFAFGYGGRQEILDAANSWIKENPGKELTLEQLESGLYAPECEDVDLLIRTGGDKRISNFLLWQAAYAELFFTDVKWPDFTVGHFKEIVSRVQRRERRFGSVEVDADVNFDQVVAQAKKQKKEFNEVVSE